MGSGIYISRDGGRKFTKITDPGLPRSPYGKTDVAIAPSDGNRMYALIQTGADGVKGMPSQAQGSLWRSDDGGKSWRNVSWDRRLIGRAGYYIRVRVSPDDPDHLLVANSTLWRSRDGGKIWSVAAAAAATARHLVGHQPTMAGHYIVTGDGGWDSMVAANPTGNTSVSLPIGQMYRVTVDQRSPHWSTAAGRTTEHADRERSSDRPANVPRMRRRRPRPAANCRRRARRRARRRWRRWRTRRRRGDGPAQESMPSCESGYTYPEPNNHRFVWGTCYASHVATFDELSGMRRSVSPWMHTLDSVRVGLKYRWQWSPPLAIDWFDNSVYFGCQLIFRTRDRGQTWEEISPDLSTRDPSRIRFSGGVVGATVKIRVTARIPLFLPGGSALGLDKLTTVQAEATFRQEGW
jgi:hypothetical protein